ncbi:MAG: nuclear transport factor 2 family protein [Rikenellaceae bacterium]
MKKSILSALCLLSVAAVSAHTSDSAKGGEAISSSVTRYTFEDFNLHIFTSPEAMGDVTLLVEGKRGLVVFEPQSFYKSIAEFNTYAQSLGKPIKSIVANYHAGGLAECDLSKVVMVEPMVEFMASPMAQGMMKHFDSVFGGAMDTRSADVKHTIPVEGVQKWAGVEFGFVSGAASDFPASSVNIGNKVYYTHFSPNKQHPSPMQLASRESVEHMLRDLIQAKESGCELFIGSHGAVASIDDVEFLIGYLERMQELLTIHSESDRFAQALMIEYPSLEGFENIRAIAKAMYPDEVANAEVEAVRVRMQDYFDMISTLDMNIAKGLWAINDNVSFINPAKHLVGYDVIMESLTKMFSQLTYRKLSSLNEVINIYGNSANVQLYWLFESTTAAGVSQQGRGRESLIFEKIDDEWRLVHVHYSRMPQ